MISLIILTGTGVKHMRKRGETVMAANEDMVLFAVTLTSAVLVLGIIAV